MGIPRFGLADANFAYSDTAALATSLGILALKTHKERGVPIDVTPRMERTQAILGVQI
jgi:hypothetical protein